MLLLWERFLTLEVNTATTLGFEAFASLSVPFFGVDRRTPRSAWSGCPSSCRHERVVAMGEIGLDCGTQFEVWTLSASTCASPRLTTCR